MLDLKILRVIAPGWPGSAIARTRLIYGVSDPDLDKKCYVMMEAMIKT